MARVGLALLALGPLLAAAYAAANRVAVEAASKAQASGPEWDGGRVGADGLTSLGADVWRLTWWTALLVGLVATGYVIIGVLLRRRSRGRTFLLVLSGFLIFPYALGFAVALMNFMQGLAAFYDAPGFQDGIPAWQPVTAWLLLAGGVAQAIGLSMISGRTRAPAATRVSAEGRS